MSSAYGAQGTGATYKEREMTDTAPVGRSETFLLALVDWMRENDCTQLRVSAVDTDCPLIELQVAPRVEQIEVPYAFKRLKGDTPDDKPLDLLLGAGVDRETPKEEPVAGNGALDDLFNVDVFEDPVYQLQVNAKAPPSPYAATDPRGPEPVRREIAIPSVGDR